jgi:hypothetical protein
VPRSRFAAEGCDGCASRVIINPIESAQALIHFC